MAEVEITLTDAEVETAFREAERFIHMFDAFVNVRNVARNYIKMKQEIVVMERSKKQLQSEIDATVAQKLKFEASHTDGVAILVAEYDQKRLATEEAHRVLVEKLKAQVSKIVHQRDELEAQAIKHAEESQKRIGEIDAKVELSGEKARLMEIQIQKQIDMKQAEFETVKANFESFLAKHHLSK